MEVTTMTRTQSVRRERNAPRCYTRPHSPIGIAGCCLVLLLGWTVACSGASGPGIGLKIGAQTLEDPISLDKTTRTRVELEISSPPLCNDSLDLAFTVGGSSLGSLSDDYTTYDEDVLIEESYDDDLALVDVRLAARLYPLGYDRDVRPHVGAGLGYFWFLDRYEYEYAQTFEDPLFPGTFYTVVDKEEGTDTVAHGFFPFVTAGLAIALTDNAELLFDFQYDFDKENQGIDLSGPIYMLGARFRF
jgi:hypothetical protein